MNRLTQGKETHTSSRSTQQSFFILISLLVSIGKLLGEISHRAFWINRGRKRTVYQNISWSKTRNKFCQSNIVQIVVGFVELFSVCQFQKWKNWFVLWETQEKRNLQWRSVLWHQLCLWGPAEFCVQNRFDFIWFLFLGAYYPWIMKKSFFVAVRSGLLHKIINSSVAGTNNKTADNEKSRHVDLKQQLFAKATGEKNVFQW